jgi:hypothetical protein
MNTSSPIVIEADRWSFVGRFRRSIGSRGWASLSQMQTPGPIWTQFPIDIRSRAIIEAPLIPELFPISITAPTFIADNVHGHGTPRGLLVKRLRMEVLEPKIIRAPGTIFIIGKPAKRQFEPNSNPRIDTHSGIKILSMSKKISSLGNVMMRLTIRNKIRFFTAISYIALKKKSFILYFTRFKAIFLSNKIRSIASEEDEQPLEALVESWKIKREQIFK